MSEPRRSTRARAREEAAPAPEPPKETPVKGAKSTLKRKRPSVVPKDSTPSTPVNESVPPEPKQTLPLRILESQPLPTLPEPQPLELSSSEWQDIQQSGVLSASLERSRAVWISGVNFRVFHKFFTQPKKPADRTEEDKAKYQRQKDLYKNFPELGKDINNTKENIEVQAQLVIEPHTFPIRLYAPREIIKHTQKKIAPPIHAYGQWPNHSQPQHSQPNQYTQYSNHGQPMYQHKPPPPRPPPPKPVQKAQTPAPGPASTPAPDPVIHALAQRAGVDPELKAVMKIVANGNASKQQLEFFQGHINELTAMLAKQKDDPAAQKAAQASSTPSGSTPSTSKPTAPQSNTTTPRPSQPLPPAPKFTPPVSAAKPVTPAPQSNIAKPTSSASPISVTKTPTPAPSTNVTKAPTPAPPANIMKPPTPGPTVNLTKPTTPSPAPNVAKPATPALTPAAPVVPASAPAPPRPVQPAQPTQPPQLLQQAPKPYSPMPPPGHMHQPPPIRQPHPPYPHGYNPPPHQQYHPPRQMQYAPPPPPTGYRPLVFSFEEGNKDLLHFPSYSFMEWLPNMSGAKFSFLVTKIKPKPEKETVVKPASTPTPKPIEQTPQGVAPNPTPGVQMPNSTVGTPAGTPGAIPPPITTPSTPSTYLPPPRIEDFDEKNDIADIEFYQPVTVLLLTENNDIRQALLRAIRPPDVVERYMDEVFDKCKRAEETYLAFRLPRDGEVEIQPEKRFKSGDATPVVATPTHDTGFSSGSGFALQNLEKKKAGRPRKSLV